MEIREELRYINQFAKTELTEDQVYVFTVRLCDNEVDRDFERFDTAALETLGEMFVGKSGIFDHQWSAKGQAGTCHDHCGRGWLLLAERLGLSDADGKECGSDH